MATYFQSNVSFSLNLLCYLSLIFQFSHIILTSCVFSHLLHILLETVSLLPLPKFTFLLILTDLQFQALNTHFLQNPVSLKLETRGVHLLPMVLSLFSHPNLLGPRNTPLLHMSFPELPCLPPASCYHLSLQKILFTHFSPPHAYYFFSCIQHENLLHILHHCAHKILAPCVSLSCSHCKD